MYHGVHLVFVHLSVSSEIVKVNLILRYLATTHFEPTSARAAFPCFDEPHMKAQFLVSIYRDTQHITLFNMPLLNTVPVEGTDIVSTVLQEVEAE